MVSSVNRKANRTRVDQVLPEANHFLNQVHLSLSNTFSLSVPCLLAPPVFSNLGWFYQTPVQLARYIDIYIYIYIGLFQRQNTINNLGWDLVIPINKEALPTVQSFNFMVKVWCRLAHRYLYGRNQVSTESPVTHQIIYACALDHDSRKVAINNNRYLQLGQVLHRPPPSSVPYMYIIYYISNNSI